MLLINHGTVMDMEGHCWQDGYVLCEGSRIVETGQNFDQSLYRGRVSGDEVLNVHGLQVLPGMLEAHCHVGITEEKKGIEGDDCNEGTTPVTPQLRALDAINPMDVAFQNAMKAGITGLMIGPGSSNVVGGQFVFLKTYGCCVDDMKVMEPAAMKVAFGENPKKNYGMNGNLPSTRMAIAAMLREELMNAQIYADKRKRQEVEPDFCMEPWIPVLERKIPLKAHVHRTDDILTAIRIGKEFGLDITLDHCSEGHLIIEEILSSGYPAIVGPAMTARNKIEVQYVDFKTVGELQRAGICVAVTTDHPVTLIQYLPICAGMAAKEGMTVENALRAITIDAAKICRVDRRLGSLKAGKDADMAIYDGNPMEVFSRNQYTIINGEIVYDAKKKEVSRAR